MKNLPRRSRVRKPPPSPHPHPLLKLYGPTWGVSASGAAYTINGAPFVHVTIHPFAPRPPAKLYLVRGVR